MWSYTLDEKKKKCCNSFALSKASLFLMKLVKNDSSVG